MTERVMAASMADAVLDALCDSPVWRDRHIGDLELHIADGIAAALAAAGFGDVAQAWAEGHRDTEAAWQERVAQARAAALNEAADAIQPGDHECFKMMCPQCAMRKQREWTQQDLRDHAVRALRDEGDTAAGGEHQWRRFEGIRGVYRKCVNCGQSEKGAEPRCPAPPAGDTGGERGVKAPTAIDRVQLRLPCETCGAEPEQWCRMPSGKRANDFHESRYREALPEINRVVDAERQAIRDRAATTDPLAGDDSGQP